MKIIIIGNGGHSSVVQDLISNFEDLTIHAILDDSLQERRTAEGVIYGPTSELADVFQQNSTKVIIAIGNNAIRKRLTAQFKLNSEDYITLTHPTAVVSRRASIGNGTVVMANAVINAGAVIGDHSIINTAGIVEHDSLMESYIHLSPAAVLTGNIKVGEGVQIGAGATVIPGMSIEEWSVVGAGAVVTKSISAFQMAVGCPAKVIKSIRNMERIS
ncbi:acetyltransferase [Jeotgalibacillus sp. S-D1]|uniref:acetyltransferase n=1 Tax=Jeotgalibacillus sp. S-D1 TaxID=2552189 RepID=UPI001059A4D1|nr:acetyltransferase [Jeotgalibacillus sp. S-D1]TDL31820.1 acetyltransferase [Jeotgalibacillus sp. S-D1]